MTDVGFLIALAVSGIVTGTFLFFLASLAGDRGGILAFLGVVAVAFLLIAAQAYFLTWYFFGLA